MAVVDDIKLRLSQVMDSETRMVRSSMYVADVTALLVEIDRLRSIGRIDPLLNHHEQ